MLHITSHLNMFFSSVQEELAAEIRTMSEGVGGGGVTGSPGWLGVVEPHFRQLCSKILE